MILGMVPCIISQESVMKHAYLTRIYGWSVAERDLAVQAAPDKPSIELLLKKSLYHAIQI